MERIKELRKAKKLTQAQLAKLLDVTQQTIAQWENGKTVPSDAKLEELARALETTVSYLNEDDKKVDIDALKEQKNQRSDKKQACEQDAPEATLEKKTEYLGVQVYPESPLLWFPISTDESSDLFDEIYSDNFETRFFVVETLNNKTLFINKEKIHHLELETYDRPDEYEKAWDGFDGLSNHDTYKNAFKVLVDGLFFELSTISDIHESNLERDIQDFIIEVRKKASTLTNNPEIINVIEDILTNKQNYWEINALFTDIKVWLKNSKDDLFYEPNDYNIPVLAQQLRTIDKESWLNFGGVSMEETRYKFIRSSDCYFVDFPSTLLS